MEFSFNVNKKHRHYSQFAANRWPFRERLNPAQILEMAVRLLRAGLARRAGDAKNFTFRTHKASGANRHSTSLFR
jgi:hypothetical protein